MDISALAQALKELGITVVTVAFLIWLVVYLIKHTLGKVTGSLDALIDSLKKHEEKADERGRYVREEHRQMIDTLGRINGFKHD
ncbi:hypothetical protein [Candidatus Magnetobacterium casense]|uniref:Uncharacterized protein n=1 Tax=Candidatus Magnetobacterium casense TaxID=1455061 RepID=A0ABS6RWS9_9BACT|nr:hypothetical protein [Candidatus Magnetobacterium casensis]MBV6341036.1 hypothetical protein [Candidatus Magnetobacterium casensis]